MNERDQVISFLLQATDNYKKQPEELQKVNTELHKKLDELKPKE
jgi:hypothetical protein